MSIKFLQTNKLAILLAQLKQVSDSFGVAAFSSLLRSFESARFALAMTAAATDTAVASLLMTAYCSEPTAAAAVVVT